jgi:hypothetical protein
MHATCPIPLILLDLMPLVTYGKDSSKCSTVLKFFQFDQVVAHVHQLFHFSVHLTTQNICDPQPTYIHITLNNNNNNNNNNNKVMQSLHRPGQALRVPGGCGSQISRQTAPESGKALSPTQRLPSPYRKYSWYSFLLEAERPRATAWSEGLC